MRHWSRYFYSASVNLFSSRTCSPALSPASPCTSSPSAPAPARRALSACSKSTDAAPLCSSLRLSRKCPPLLAVYQFGEGSAAAWTRTNRRLHWSCPKWDKCWQGCSGNGCSWDLLPRSFSIFLWKPKTPLVYHSTWRYFQEFRGCPHHTISDTFRSTARPHNIIPFHSKPDPAAWMSLRTLRVQQLRKGIPELHRNPVRSGRVFQVGIVYLFFCSPRNYGLLRVLWEKECRII